MERFDFVCWFLINIFSVVRAELYIFLFEFNMQYVNFYNFTTLASVGKRNSG